MKLFRSLNNNHGFSLIELLVVLTISSVLISIAVPYYGNQTRQGKSNANFNLIFRSVQLARSTAINEGTFVSVCPTANNLNANVIRCANTGDFFVALRDLDQNGVLDGNDADTIALGIVKFSSFQGAGTSNTTANRNTAVTFQPDGNTFNTASQGSMFYCANQDDPQNPAFRQIMQSVIIAATGRARQGDWSGPAFGPAPCP